jgi:hypothetical protein
MEHLGWPVLGAPSADQLNDKAKWLIRRGIRFAYSFIGKCDAGEMLIVYLYGKDGVRISASWAIHDQRLGSREYGTVHDSKLDKEISEEN